MTRSACAAVAEPGGRTTEAQGRAPTLRKASLSRFQFLIFTFVIAGLYLLLSIEAGTFVDIRTMCSPARISGGSFLVSKGMSGSQKKKPDVEIIEEDDPHEGHREEVTRSGEHGQPQCISFPFALLFSIALGANAIAETNDTDPNACKKLWSEIGLPAPNPGDHRTRDMPSRLHHRTHDNNKTRIG